MAEIKITRRCKENDCKQQFSISQGEALWYKEQSLELPKRCPDCRKRNSAKKCCETEQKI